MLADDRLQDGDTVLLISHGNTLISLADRYGQGKIQVHERPENGSIAHMTLSEAGIEITQYNNKKVN